MRQSAEELISLAKRTGARVIRGPVRSPGHEAGLYIGDVDIEELLAGLKDQEVLVIITRADFPQQLRSVCGLCGALYEGTECPVCKEEREEAKRLIEERLLFDEGFSGLLSRS